MLSILAVIPVYNHPQTIAQVAAQAIVIHPQLLVVDDGSDIPVESLLAELKVPVLRHEHNRGKGQAILSAADYALAHGYTHIITLDADGQHDPAELIKFVEAIKSDPESFWVGARNFDSAFYVPFSSRFGRRFSEFWMFLQTAQRVDDMQSGYRAYPLAALKELKIWGHHFSFEIEVLVKAAWAGFKISELPVAVFYPEPGNRVSHFKFIRDNVRIFLLNTRLTIRALIPVPFRELNWDAVGRVTVLRPRQALRRLLADQATAASLAKATFMALMVCALPLLGLQSILVLLLIAVLKLNRPWALAVCHACLPPLMPAFCIQVGHYFRHGVWLYDISWQTLGREVGARFTDWLLGAALGGPVLALGLSLVVYWAARLLSRTL